jgi:hypothetical protein
MILLVTSSERGPKIAIAIEAATGENTIVAESLFQATTRLREGSYLAVVLDQHLAETEPLETDTLLHHLETAVLVPVNLAISGQERLVREVRTALSHRQHDELLARRLARSELLSELNGTLTALLLTVELAIDIPAVPIPAAEKLQSIYGLVKKLRRQVENDSANEHFETASAGLSQVLY